MIGIKVPVIKKGEKGSVLFEAVACVIPFTLLFFLSIELFRAGFLHVLLGQAAFIYTRDRALGKSKPESKYDVYLFLEKAMGTENRKKLQDRLDIDDERQGHTIEGKVHLRYLMFTRFEMHNSKNSYWHHHMEVTKTCRFPG